MNGEVKQYLSHRGFCVISTCKIENLQPPLNTHTDIQLVKIGERVICAPCVFSYYQDKIPNLIPGKTDPVMPYPHDTPYNCLVIGKRVFHRVESTDPVVLEEIRRQGFCSIPVRQGYAACSTLAVSEQAAITADEGMAKAMTEQGIEVFRLSPGDIRLLGYPYGFIGGSGGCISENEVLFFGTPQAEGLDLFLEKHGKSKVIFPFPIEDFGGLICASSPT